MYVLPRCMNTGLPHIYFTHPHEVTLGSTPDGLLICCTLDVDSAISMYPVKSSVCTTTLKQTSSKVHN